VPTLTCLLYVKAVPGYSKFDDDTIGTGRAGPGDSVSAARGRGDATCSPLEASEGVELRLCRAQLLATFACLLARFHFLGRTR
jgi:hypothetical protein